jgi:hypothetical protein
MGDLAGLRQAGLNAEGLGELGDDLDLCLAARELVSARPEVFEAYRDRQRAEATP